MRVDSIIRRLETNPFLGKPLKGNLAGKWSLRAGDYRIIYTIDDSTKTIILLTIRARRAAYK